MKPDNICMILNKLHAMKSVGMVTLRDISKATGEREQRIGEWVTRRIRRPTADSAFKLQAFAAKMTLNISRKPALAVKYRAAYSAACVLFPVDGKESR